MRGFGSCYRQKGSRFWWIQFWQDGTRFRESTGKEKLREAQEVLKAKLVKLASGDRPAAAAGTVAELYEALERDYVINRRKSIEGLRGAWSNHLEEAFAAMPSAKLDADAVAVYVERRQAAGAANASINRELAALKRMFKLALETKKLRLAPAIQMLKERNVRKGFVKDAQYSELARATAAEGLWLRAMFEMGYTYGWRKGELLALRVGQVDLIEHTIDLNPGETKNDEGRVVEMTAKVYELLQECCRGKSADEPVFTRDRDHAGRRPRTGGRITDIRDAWARACIEAGQGRMVCQEHAEALDKGRCAACKGPAKGEAYRGLLFHDLRRSGVRNMRRMGIPERVAMRISGHKTASVFHRYNIVDPSDLRDAARRMERAASDRRQRDLFEGAQGEIFDGFRGLEGAGEARKPNSRVEIDSHRTVIDGRTAKPN